MPNKALTASLTANFADDPNIITDLKLEQQEWPTKDTIRTFLQILDDNGWYGWDLGGDPSTPNYIYNKSQEEYFAQCSLNDDGSYDTTIYVYFHSDEYDLKTSNGTFGLVSSIVLEKEDSVLISLNSDYKFQWNIKSLIEASWEGDVYTPEGIIIDDPPVITLEGNKLVWEGSSIYGSIRYKVEVEAYSHELNVPIIPGAVDNIHASNIMAFWNDDTDASIRNNRVTTLEFKTPPEEKVCNDIIIDIQSGTDPDSPIDTPDPDPTIVPVPVLFSFFDYCTGEVIDADSISIDGGADITDFATPVMLVPGDYIIKIIADGYISSDLDDLGNDTFTITVPVTPNLPTV